jgi:hypothetical protein
MIEESSKLVDIYIQNLLSEVSELSKTKLLLQAKLIYNEQLNVELINKIKDLEVQLDVKKMDNDKHTF